MNHRFTAEIYKFSSNPSFCCVDVPADISAAFGKKGIVPVQGTVNGIEWRGNLLPNAKGGHRMILNGKLRKQARAGVGDTVVVSVQLDEESREIAMPEELAEALRASDLLDKFNTLPLYHQRYVLLWLQSAKTRPTWERRVETLVMRLATNTLAPNMVITTEVFPFPAIGTKGIIMKTIWQMTDKQELLTRLAQLNAAALPQWGKMNCGQMLAHLTDALHMTLGDLALKPRGGPLRYWPLKQLIIYWLPFPKGAPTAPELLVRSPVEIEPEIAALQTQIERFTASTTRQDWPEHPAFGKLSAQDWGVLIYRHMDHHLRQFRV